MVPALGRQRAHHFKHKAGRPKDCLHETYLHHLAKMVLYSALRAAMREGRPYLLIRPHPIICDRFEAGYGITCRDRSLPLPEDLAARFDSVHMERGIDGFVADILLETRGTGARMLIEIAVSHPCSPDKLASGLDILEIRVRTEADIERLKDGIDAAGHEISLHGPGLSRPDPVRHRCASPCAVSGLLLLLYRNGKAWYAESSLAAIEDIISDPHLLAWEIADPRRPGERRTPQSLLDLLADFMIRQKYLLGRPVASCLLCQNNGGRMNEHDIHCLARERVVWMSSSASGCPDYAPACDAEAARQLILVKGR